ncbi:MAG: hypothetical protein LBP26_02590 [Clostridiales bacterium]|nr:hypothetical protein [Clostridiales bacterium]
MAVNKKKIEVIISVASVVLAILLVIVFTYMLKDAKYYFDRIKEYAGRELSYNFEEVRNWAYEHLFLSIASLFAALLIVCCNVYYWFGKYLFKEPTIEQIAAYEQKRKERIEAKKRRLEEKLKEFDKGEY